MEIAEAGRDDPTRYINALGIVGRLDDEPIAHGDVPLLVAAVRRVDHPAADQHEAGGWISQQAETSVPHTAPQTSARTAIRIGTPFSTW